MLSFAVYKDYQDLIWIWCHFIKWNYTWHANSYDLSCEKVSSKKSSPFFRNLQGIDHGSVLRDREAQGKYLPIVQSVGLGQELQPQGNYPSSRNHGSVENGCISNISFLS